MIPVECDDMMTRPNRLDLPEQSGFSTLKSGFYTLQEMKSLMNPDPLDQVSDVAFRAQAPLT